MSFNLPWVNPNVLNATKRLQRLTPSTPSIPGMPAPAAPFVPETAPAFGDYGPWIPGMPAPTRTMGMADELGLQSQVSPAQTVAVNRTDVAAPYFPLDEAGFGFGWPGVTDRPPDTRVDTRERGMAEVFGSRDTRTDVPDADAERMGAILAGNIPGHVLSGYHLMPPVLKEFAMERYKADWQKTQEALERSDSRVSGFQTFLDTVDFTSAYFGGSMVDAWNSVKSAVGGDFAPVQERFQEGWSVGGRDEPESVIRGMAPDFGKKDLGVGDHIQQFFGNEWDKLQDTANRQQERSGKTRFFSELLLPFEAGAAATLTRTGFNLVRATPAFARAGAQGMSTVTRATVKQIAAVSDYPSWMWEEGYTWEPAFRQRGGIVIPNSMGQAQLEEFGLLLDEKANIFAGPLRSMREVIPSIATSDTPMLRFALKMSGINPSVDMASISPAGKLLVGMNMQKVASEEMINTALLAGYDRHGAVGVKRFFGGGSPLQKISDEGFYGDTGALWQEVFANPRSERFKEFVSGDEIRMIDDYNSITNIEIPRMLDEVGISAAERANPKSEWYVPRNVLEIKNLADDLRVNYERIQNNPELARTYEDIMDGFDAGVRYDIDPRRTLELHLRWAYRKIIKKQFTDELESQGISHTSKELVGTLRADRYRAAMDYVRVLATKRRRVASAVRTALKHESVAKTTLNEGERATRITVQDVDMLDQIIQTTTYPDLDTPRVWAKATASSVRLQEAVIRKLDRARDRADKQLSLAIGREAGTERGMLALQGLYNDLEQILDNVTVTPHLSDDEVRTALKGPRKFREAVESGRPITEIKMTERQKGKYFQTKYGLRKIDAKLQTASRRFRNEGDAIEEVTDLRDSIDDALEMARADLAVAKKNLNAAESLVRRNKRTTTFRQGQQSARKNQLVRQQNRSKANRGRVMRASERLEDVRGRRQMLESIRDALDAQLVEGKAELNVARNGGLNDDGTYVLADGGLPIGYRAAMKYYRDRMTAHADGALWGKKQGDKITIGQWQNRWLTHSDATLIDEYYKKNQVALISENTAIKGLSILANSVRFLSAVGDFAMPFIQGQLVLATNPEAWAKMTLRHYQAWFDPTVQAKLVSENLADYQQLARMGIPIGDPEFFSAMQAGQGLSVGAALEFLPKGAEFRQLMRHGGKQTFGRFQASYNAGLGHARMLLYKGARESWEGTHAKLASETLVDYQRRIGQAENELAQYVRNLTGGLDTRALGVGPGARQAENLWLAFSPRLLRSTIAIVADGILNPTSPQGKRAWRTLGTWAAGAHGMYVLSGMAMGKDWDELAEGLNPLNGKRYLSHQINGDWVGIGGQVRAMMQLMYGLTMGAYQEPSNLVAPNLQDNPLLRFLSGRGAVGLNLVGGAVEAGTGGKVNALQFDDVDGPLDYLAHLGTSAMPFVVQGLLEGEQWPTAGAAMVGARTSPETAYDRRRVERMAEARRQGFEVEEWSDLEGDERNAVDEAIRANSPEIYADIEKVNESWDSDTYYYQSKQKTIEDKYVGLLDGVWDDSYKDGKYPWGKKFRERVDELRGEKARDLKALRDSANEFIFARDDNTGERVRMKNSSYDPRMRGALDDFEEMEPSELEFDLALTEYIEVMYGQDSPDEKELMSLKLVDAATPEYQIQELWGEYDYDERERRERHLQEKLGATMLERVKRYLKKGDPDAVQQLDADREVLAESGYWRANESVKTGKPLFWQAAWDEYLDEPDPVLKASIIVKYEDAEAESGNIIRDMKNERDDLRLDIRAIYPEVTAILLRHGYGIQAPRDWEGIVPWLEYDQKILGNLAWEEAYPWASVPTSTPTP
jgi:hypothetical protein